MPPFIEAELNITSITKKGTNTFLKHDSLRDYSLSNSVEMSDAVVVG